MKRREFLKGVAVGGAAYGMAANATQIISDDLMNDENAKMTASHFGPLRGLAKNGKFEGIADAAEIDFYPVSLIQGVLARTYDDTRIARPAVRKGYLEKGYKSDKSKRGEDEWVEIGWEQAYKLVADELKRVYKEYGGSAIYGGSYGWYSVGSVNNPQTLLGRMLNILGGYTTRTLTYSTHAIRAITPLRQRNRRERRVTNRVADHPKRKRSSRYLGRRPYKYQPNRLGRARSRELHLF